MKIRLIDLIFSIMIVGIFFWWVFFSPIIDNPDLYDIPIRVGLTFLFFFGGALFWIFALYKGLSYIRLRFEKKHE